MIVFYIVFVAVLAVFIYFLTRFSFALLLRGFVPMLPSRPWVVEEIMSELELKNDTPVIVAFSSGRSGLIHALEKKYPQAVLTGVEPHFFSYVVARVQTYLRFTRIKVIRQPVHRVDVKQADLVYSHLYPDDMRGLGKKLKFECRPDTIVVSTGFNIPDLAPAKIVDLPDRRGRLDWLSKNQKLFQRKSKKFKKEKKAFYYVI